MSATFQFVPEEHAYIQNGIRVPSVTQILELVGIVDYSHIPDSILDRKAEIGTAAHAAAHYYDEGDLDLNSVGEEASPYVTAWMKFRAETNFKPDLIEYRGIANVDGMEYGYTLDRVGTFQGRPHLLEIKCTAAVEISWGPQTAAYELALRPTTKQALRRMAVHLKPNGNYSLIELGDTKDYQIFKWALGLVHWMQLKGRQRGNASNHFAR
jgi:hypothetical protein